MPENGNGYKSLWIVFWIFAVIIFPTLFFLGSNVIANERDNKSCHTELREMIYTKLDSINNRLTRIETKLEK